MRCLASELSCSGELGPFGHSAHHLSRLLHGGVQGWTQQRRGEVRVFALVGGTAASYSNNHVKQLTAAACDRQASVLSTSFPLRGVNEAERENSLSRVT